MNRMLKNIIRVGRVSSVAPEKATARVVFEAQDIVSHDLQIIVPQTLKNKDYYIPDIGEHVVCLFLPTGNQEGFILGSVYTDEDKPPVSSPDKRVTKFKDGTTIEYDHSTSTFSINAVGNINIVAAGGDIVVNDISFVNHTHPETGGSETGSPQ